MVNLPPWPCLDQAHKKNNAPQLYVDNDTVFPFVNKNLDGLIDSLDACDGDTQGTKRAVSYTVARGLTLTGCSNNWTVPMAVFGAGIQ